MRNLTRAEEQVMHSLWKIEKGFAKEVIENIEGKKPAYNTILTILRILVDKKIVEYEKFGKSFRYHPVFTKEEYSKFKIGSLREKYFDNSAKNLMSFLIKEEGLSLKELEEILNELKK